MRITFLVGNGFDLNCGLHTQYSDFYKYFIEKHPQNTIACEIADNPENWADLELSIGKYIEKVSGENRETFLNDLAELEEELRDYLQSENQRIVIGNEIGGEFHDKVVCFFDGMRPVDKADIANLRRCLANDLYLPTLVSITAAINSKSRGPSATIPFCQKSAFIGLRQAINALRQPDLTLLQVTVNGTSA